MLLLPAGITYTKRTLLPVEYRDRLVVAVRITHRKPPANVFLYSDTLTDSSCTMSCHWWKVLLTTCNAAMLLQRAPMDVGPKQLGYLAAGMRELRKTDNRYVVNVPADFFR